MKKLLILSMYCNEPFFLAEEQTIRHTWAKPILEGSYPDIDFYGYTASTDGKYHVDTSIHTIQIPADDGLEGTAEKTMKCLKLIKYLGWKYDCIFRTNTSTYINVPLLREFVNTQYNTKMVWSSSIFSSNDKGGPFRHCFHARGNTLLVSNGYVDIITDTANITCAFEMESSNDGNNEIGQIQDVIYKVDDNFMSFVYNSYLINKMEPHTKYYKQFGAVGAPDIVFFDMSDYIAITYRIYDETSHTRDYENIICQSIDQHINKERTNLLMTYEFVNDDLINCSYARKGEIYTIYHWMPRQECIMKVKNEFGIDFVSE